MRNAGCWMRANTACHPERRLVQIPRRRAPRDDSLPASPVPLLQRFEVRDEIRLLLCGERQSENTDVVIDDGLERCRAAIVKVRTLQLRRMRESAERRGSIPFGRTPLRILGALPRLGGRMQLAAVDVRVSIADVAARAFAVAGEDGAPARHCRRVQA